METEKFEELTEISTIGSKSRKAAVFIRAKSNGRQLIVNGSYFIKSRRLKYSTLNR